MATAASPPSSRKSNGGFFDVLPDIGVGDLIGSIASGNWDAASHFTTGNGSTATGDTTGINKESKFSQHKVNPFRRQSSRVHDSKVVDITTGRGLLGSDNGGPIDTNTDFSAVVALDKKNIQKRREEKKWPGSRNISKSNITRRNSTGGLGRGGKSIKSRGSIKEGKSGSPMFYQPTTSNKNIQRSQTTIGTVRNIKSGRKSKTVSSMRNARASGTIRTSTMSKSPGGYIALSAQVQSSRTTDSKTSRRDPPPISSKNKRHKHRKGISKGSKSGRAVRSKKTTKAPSVHSSSVSNTVGVASTKVKGSVNGRNTQGNTQQIITETRDDQSVGLNSIEEEYGSYSDEDSSTYGGSSTSADNCNDSSDDDSDGTDDDSDNSDTDDETKTDDKPLSRAMRSIGIPIAGIIFDEDELSIDYSEHSKRSKASVESNRSRGSAKSKGSNKSKSNSKIPEIVENSDSGSEIEDSEFYQGGPGDVLHSTSKQYRIVDELGKGTFGRVMKAYEIKGGSLKEKVGLGSFRGKILWKRRGAVAVKITRNVEKYKRDAEIEADMLRKVNRSGSRGTQFFPKLMDEFCSPMGHHCGE